MRGTWPQLVDNYGGWTHLSFDCPQAAAPDFYRNPAQRPHSLCYGSAAQRMYERLWGQESLRLRPLADTVGTVVTRCKDHGNNVTTRHTYYVHRVLNMMKTTRANCGHHKTTMCSYSVHPNDEFSQLSISNASPMNELDSTSVVNLSLGVWR